jgi:hypothetical protein
MRRLYTYLSILLTLILQGSVISAQNGNGSSKFIEDKFIQYISNYPREEIYVHTDREKYVAGEDVWFKVYLADRRTGTLSSISKIAYFEILNDQNRPVVRKRIGLYGGTGPGHIVLPDTLSSGTYTIRAYTSWMKNFLPGNCFMKEILIYNALADDQGIVHKSVPSATIPQQAENPVEVSIQTDNSDPEKVTLTVTAAEAFLKNNGKICRMFIHTYGYVNYSGDFILDGEKTIRTFPRKTMRAGINHITLFSFEGKPLAEKFIYTPEMSGTEFSLKSADLFSTRENVLMGIIPGGTDNGNTASLSISVIPASGERKALNIGDYMVFGSEFGYDFQRRLLQGYSGKLVKATVDSLLMSARSNWISWNDILADNKPVLKYDMEEREHFISGSLISTGQNDSLSGRFIILAIPGKKTDFQYAITDKKGYFKFSLPVDQVEKHLIIQPAVANENRSIKLESSFSEEYLPAGNSGDKIMPDQLFRKWGVNYQVGKIYGTSFSRPSPVTLRSANTKRFYGKPDNELIMDNYIKLPVMEEVFFELLPGTFLKKRKSVYDVSILDPVTNDMYREPHLFVDGVKIDNAGTIASLDPELVEEIDVVRARYMVGDYLFRGIVNVITRAGDFSNVSLPDNAVNVYYRVIDPVETIWSPSYSEQSSKQSRIPDFRNTLYWDPLVNCNGPEGATVSFWSSDYSSLYDVIIEGVTPDGHFISTQKTITIK